MRIEMKHEAELEKRKGLTGRTILAFIWLFASFVVSILLAIWLLIGDIIGTRFFYQDLGISDTVSEVVLIVAVAFIIFLLIQLIVLIGYAAFSPKAKMRTGTPSAYSSNPDPYDQTYDGR
jgi:uncharacterized BrkB/YihY/UPF0761 family membrane protein